MLVITVQIFSLCQQIFPCVRTKFPVFSLSGKSKNQIPCFPCAVATLIFFCWSFFSHNYRWEEHWHDWPLIDPSLLSDLQSDTERLRTPDSIALRCHLIKGPRWIGASSLVASDIMFSRLKCAILKISEQRFTRNVNLNHEIE